MKYFWVVFLVLACSSNDIFNIDYDNEETTYKTIYNGSEKLLAEKRYSEVEFAYNYLKEKHPKFYKDTVFMKHIELYGLQERFEVQIDYYRNIFKTDSVDNEKFVPHFYNQIGKSYYSMAKAKVDRRVDTATVKHAISYFQKAYKYQLYIDNDINASSLYYEALCHITINDTSKAKEKLNLVVSNYINTKIHSKAYFKTFDLASPRDIELTDAQLETYNKLFTKVQTDTVENILEEPEEKTVVEDSIVDSNNNNFPKQITQSEETKINQTPAVESKPKNLAIKDTTVVKKPVVAKKDSTITNKIKDLIKKKKADQKKQKKTSSGEFILENTED